MTGDTLESMSTFGSVMKSAAATLSAALLLASPAGAVSSGSSGSSGSSASSAVDSLSSGSSILLDRLFPETEEQFLERVTNPLDDSYIPLHPVLQEDLYRQVFDPPQLGECPAVTVIAARGSEQNSQFRPARYSEEAPWTSNGFEERNIRYLFGRMEQEHVRETGVSLMKDVYVMGLSHIDYPAAMPLSSEGSTAIEFGSSLITGRESVMEAIDRFEMETGCRSQYLLVGYSQGVLVVDGQEPELIDRDQYVGTLLVANPALRADDPTIIGHRSAAGGLISSVDEPVLDHPNKINYCLPGDVVCDRAGEQFSTSGSSLAGAYLSTGESRGGRAHLQYFVTPHTWDEEVMSTVAGWISDAVDRAG